MNLEEIRKDIVNKLEHLSENEINEEFIDAVNLFDNLCKELPETQQQEEMQKVVDSIQKDKYLTAIYIYSLFTFRIHDKKWMEEMLETILKVQDWREETLYFMYWQIATRFMIWPECESINGKAALWKLFRRTCSKYATNVNSLKWIEEKERNKDFVVVIMAQYLDPTHGPSKTALDRCKALMKAMHKEVLLINTAEALSVVGNTIPWAYVYNPIYAEELRNEEWIEWKGEKIPFVQCDNNMPNIDVLNFLIQEIVRMKPQFVVEIGTGSILANLVSKCLPVLSVVTGFSRLAVTETQYQVSALRISDKERWILGQVGKEESHVIPTTFTFGLKEQQETLTREELGLPENMFLAAVIGMRLDWEIDDEFMQMLKNIHNSEVGIVFIGNFPKFESFLSKYPELKDQMYYLGERKDVLAILEVCELFLNPIRLGGGTSAAEALCKGLPAVSTSYGDVGATVGEDFWVEDYAEMAEIVNRYRQDKEFYRKQSELAKRRAENLLDTDGEFVKVIKEFGNRMGEHYMDVQD